MKIIIVCVQESVCNLYFSVSKGSMCVMPFAMFMFIDVALSLLSLFDARFGLPGTPTYGDALRLAVRNSHSPNLIFSQIRPFIVLCTSTIYKVQ